MAAEAGQLVLKIKSQGHVLAPLAVLMVVFLILVPLPPLVLDLFFTLNIILSIIILLMSTYIEDPVQFSVYPSVLLLSTLYRVALNISAARLILSRGEEGVNAAGRVIGSFGQFVVSGSYLIGIVVLTIILAIQKMVISAGAGRSGEVAARYTLEKMHSQQMGIETDIKAGIITQSEAMVRRRRIEQEAQFFGAMDGAVNYTAKEANVTIVITLINIFGGILVGMTQKGMDFFTAGQIYTILSIGAGLMAAVPSLLMTAAGGIISTRAGTGKTLGEDMTEQALYHHYPLMMAAAGLGILALIPGLPKIPFFLLAGLFGYLSYQVKKNRKIEIAKKVEAEKKEEAAPSEKIEALLKVDLLGLEIGSASIPLVDKATGAPLLQRLKTMRKQLASDLGIIVPSVRIRDNLQLGTGEYSILIKGVPVTKDEVMPGHFLAIDPGNIDEKVKGIETKDPAFGMPAYWITGEERERAQSLGYTIVEPAAVIAAHLTEIIKGHAHELLGLQETQRLVENLASTNPKVVEELIPHLMTLGTVRKVLQNLLRERVSILDLGTILETLVDFAPTVRDITALTELTRRSLSRQLVKPYLTGKNDLPVLVLGGEPENLLVSRLQKIDEEEQLIIDPGEAQGLINKIKSGVEKASLKARPILLCSSIVRHHLRRLVEGFIPGMVILSASEVPKSVRIVSLGVVE